MFSVSSDLVAIVRENILFLKGDLDCKNSALKVMTYILLKQIHL